MRHVGLLDLMDQLLNAINNSVRQGVQIEIKMQSGLNVKWIIE
jgi:hypothetical protein